MTTMPFALTQLLGRFGASDSFVQNALSVLEKSNHGSGQGELTQDGWASDPTVRVGLERLWLLYARIELALMCSVIHELPAEVAAMATHHLSRLSEHQPNPAQVPALAKGLLLRIAAPANGYVAENHDEAETVFVSFLNINALVEDDSDVQSFMELLKGRRLDGISFDEVCDRLKTPDDPMSALGGQNTDAAFASAVRGVRGWVLFCVQFLELLERVVDPVLRSAIWHFHAYWFDEGDRGLRLRIDTLLSNLEKWPAEEGASAPELQARVNRIFSGRFGPPYAEWLAGCNSGSGRVAASTHPVVLLHCPEHAGSLDLGCCKPGRSWSTQERIAALVHFGARLPKCAVSTYFTTIQESDHPYRRLYTPDRLSLEKAVLEVLGSLSAAVDVADLIVARQDESHWETYSPSARATSRCQLVAFLLSLVVKEATSQLRLMSYENAALSDSVGNALTVESLSALPSALHRELQERGKFTRGRLNDVERAGLVVLRTRRDPSRASAADFTRHVSALEAALEASLRFEDQATRAASTVALGRSGNPLVHRLLNQLNSGYAPTLAAAWYGTRTLAELSEHHVDMASPGGSTLSEMQANNEHHRLLLPTRALCNDVMQLGSINQCLLMGIEI